MHQAELTKLYGDLVSFGLDVGSKLLGALVLWFVGRFAIGLVRRAIGRGMTLRRIDETLIRYVESATNALLNIVLALAVLGIFGVQTTSFAAMLAGAGLAIGTAWGGLLQSFAAGIFLLLLKPFRKGDEVTMGGVSGVVEEVGLFSTTVTSGDGVRVFISNSKVLGDNIHNMSAHPHRRVDRSAQIAHGVDHKRAIELLRARVSTLPNVLKEPAPELFLLDFNLAGPVLAVRPYCRNEHYGQVFGDTNEAIREELSKAGFPVPEQHLHIANGP